MSARTSRRRTPIHSGRKKRPPHPTPSPHRPNPPSNRPLKPSKPIKTLNRCSSEPILWSTIGSVEEDDPQRLQSQVLIFRPKTCADVLASPLRSLPPSPYSSSQSFYREDSKVVVNVTVEGSPGPVRAMVSLGASVEETIKLVVDKYSQEGRSPCLHRDAASTFELHQSYFSLESLNKWERIGDVGSRSFFLRKSCSSNTLENEDGGGRGSEVEDSRPPLMTSQLFYSFIARRISKIGRRTRKIWKILGCIGSS